MYAEVIKGTAEQAVTKPEAAECGVIYGEVNTTVNEQMCVGKYLCVHHMSSHAMYKYNFRKPTKDDSPGSEPLYPVWTTEANFFPVVSVRRVSYPNATPEPHQDCQLQ